MQTTKHARRGTTLAQKTSQVQKNWCSLFLRQFHNLLPLHQSLQVTVGLHAAHTDTCWICVTFKVTRMMSVCHDLA